ncbi:bifunctional alpha/beta hydrolase/class I SAM-dependent methyltransferase [Poriferisphaera sp. WC338]|uniref:bifunctional alpha/beta hydrolase/class I SAM-dependent methyltransferase n=1 Tax=Poriferisphaera sp. WC338 TaxID=3425129 RepID=UPI003D81B00E
MDKLQAIESQMQSFDGNTIFYREWIPQNVADKAVVIFHRGHEHSGRLSGLVEQLNLDGFACFAWDARGNGRSEGPRDWAEHFGVYAKDADVFVRHVSQKHHIPIENMAVIGNSVGSVIASSWVHDYAPPIRALIMATPAFRIKLYVPFAVPMLRLGQKLNLMKNVPSYVKGKVLTHDKAEQQAFADDPLITHGISTNILLGLHDTATRIIQDAGAIRVPTQMHVAGNDWVVKVKPQREFFDRLGSDEKEWYEYPNFYHAIYHEQGKELAIDRTRQFILKYFDEKPACKSLIKADRSGYTYDEYQSLQKPKFSIFYSTNRLGINTLGRLSKGIRIGLKDGFDSGVMLDYVYQNKSNGQAVIGKMIDQTFLDSIGWRGIRVRKVNMKNTLRNTINMLDKEGKSVRIVDIAAGPGRYVMETIKEMNHLPIEAQLRDYKQVNVEAGQKLVKELGLDRVYCEIGDAFDQEQIASIAPKPTLGIVSGLYELFPDNQGIQRSLQGLAAAIEKDGYLIYTNQPWHPQVEYIARVLDNREGENWVMRRRTQEEMDELVGEAGFEKIGMEIDPWGIFTVSVAKRI